MSGKPAVLFVCVHNAGRSQMAAGWLRHLAGDQIEVFSAGTQPAEAINPLAAQAMAEVGIDISSGIPAQLTEDDGVAADVIITMGCGDTCPAFPGKRYEDWQVDNPAGKDLPAVGRIRDDIRKRIEKLIIQLTN